MSTPTAYDSSRWLADLHGGDPSAAARLLPLVYDELHALAGRALRNEREGHTLQPTALVHEVYLRMLGQHSVEWTDRAHFLAICARALRRVLLDHARRRRSEKRGEGRERITLTDIAAPDDDEFDVLELHEALERLAELDLRQSRVVELRFFAGLDVDEAAHVLGVSPRTVDGDWYMARAWLRRELSREPM